MSLFVHQVRSEQLLFWRSREAAIFVFLFPVMLLLLLGAVYDGEIDGHPAGSWLLVGMIGPQPLVRPARGDHTVGDEQTAVGLAAQHAGRVLNEWIAAGVDHRPPKDRHLCPELRPS